MTKLQAEARRSKYEITHLLIHLVSNFSSNHSFITSERHTKVTIITIFQARLVKHNLDKEPYNS